MNQSGIQQSVLRTPEECEKLLVEIDGELERREGRIRIATREHWRLKRFVSRLTGFLWARQVEQRQDGVCDSPYIEVLERRATTDLAEQGIDYDRIINSIGHIAEVCQERLDDLNAVLDANQAHAKEKIEVDLGNAGKLGDDAKTRMEEHDRSVLASRRQAQVRATKEKIAPWQAVLKHALATQSTANADKRQAEAMVRAHYSEQAQEHLKWALRKNALKSPFLLPGALSGIPVLDSAKEVQAC